MDNFGADNSSLEPIPSSARKNGASPLFLSLVASAVLEDRSQSIVESFVRDNRFRKKKCVKSIGDTNCD